MTSTIKTSKGKVNLLDKDCIIDLHELLSKSTHLLSKMDPVEPPGVKNVGMLESAIGRQYAGFGDFYKYDNPFSNCATLVFGIIKNHSFHNGNKRAGLLALIKHLYVNGYVLNPELKSEELYQFLVSIAESKIRNFHQKNKKKYTFIQDKVERDPTIPWETDTDIRFMSFWIKKNARPKMNILKGELKISTLKKLLSNKDIRVDQNGTTLEIYKLKKNKFLGISLKPTAIHKKKYKLKNTIKTISLPLLNRIRRDFELTKAQGVDNTFFYEESSFLDQEIMTYKEIIYRLSKT